MEAEAATQQTEYKQSGQYDTEQQEPETGRHFMIISINKQVTHKHGQNPLLFRGESSQQDASSLLFD